ncbi:hypothetical protein MN608_05582 [Microdochium nivale]|nr:hypothetical protein MN608_05582 [Microdochium nivale]
MPGAREELAAVHNEVELMSGAGRRYGSASEISPISNLKPSLSVPHKRSRSTPHHGPFAGASTLDCQHVLHSVQQEIPTPYGRRSKNNFSHSQSLTGVLPQYVLGN